MHRRVLVAEQADTIRSVAETVLRQNGYDVIAVTAAEKAREVLGLSRPDLIIVGADLVAPDGSPYYERIRQDPKTADIPLLLFEPADKTDLAFPDEVVIPRPFDPGDFIHKVSVFLGTRDTEPPGDAGPQGDSDVDDKFLDAALGLDQIDVMESEVLDQTVVGTRKKSRPAKEKMIGLDASPDLEDTGTDVSTIDSLAIDEDSSQIKRRVPGRTAPQPDGTGKIEILSDQFGLVEPPAIGQDENAVHDYDWFVDAIKKDDDPADSSETPGASDSGQLTVADPSAAVDPVTPGPPSPPSPPVKSQASQPGGAEKFIDEFKKEMEQIRAAEPDQIASGPVAPEGGSQEMAWEEKLEQIGPAQIDIFMREFARELGRKVAEILAAKVDPEKLLRLIRSELAQRRNKSE